MNYKFFSISSNNLSEEEIALQVLDACEAELEIDAKMGFPGALSRKEIENLRADQKTAEEVLKSTKILVGDDSITPKDFMELRKGKFVDWTKHTVGGVSFSIN